MAFKKVQTADKYPKGQSRGRQWKHLRHLLQAADATSLPPDRPNYLNIQSPPSVYPPKRYCDVTGFEAPYVDPRTKLRYADPEVFRQIRMLPEEYVQRRTRLLNPCAIERDILLLCTVIDVPFVPLCPVIPVAGVLRVDG
uniref:Vps72/YL1 C-terminal domain-containing protein n=1 Tax=Aegilops tauschii TaxID=37682 RepID=R7WFD5_AEGTA